MKPSIDPEKAAQREELARQMAEFEKKHGAVKTSPSGTNPDYDGFTTKAHREEMRARAAKNGRKTRRVK